MEAEQDGTDRVFYAAYAARPYPSEDYGVDSKDDTSKPFNRIHQTPERFRQQLVELASRSFVRTSTPETVRNLRFLSVQQCGNDSVARANGPDEALGTQRTAAGELRLTLKEHRSSIDPVDYVAISYCWSRDKTGWFTELRLASVPVQLRGDMLAAAEPADVLYRASSFVRRHDVDHIWIDQFCIDQTDPQDKAANIQNMDIVYQRSVHPVAILESFVEMQAQLDAFAKLFTPEELREHELEDLEEVLSVLRDDAWFTRAWTLQEATAAGTNMILLIGCDPSLDKPSFFGSEPVDVEVELPGLQMAMMTARLMMEDFLAREDSDITTATSISNLADEIFNFLPSFTPRDFVPGEANAETSLERQICTAAETVNFLQQRKNTIFSDRLAILGNMCDYKIRLPGECVDQQGFSFSTCVLAQSILNGDMSLLARYSNPYVKAYLSRDGINSIGLPGQISDSPSRMFGFSWGPPPTAALRNIEFYNTHDEIYQIRPATLTVEGLQVKGVLWQMDGVVELPRTRAEHAAAWEEVIKSLDFKELSPAAEDELTYSIAQNFVFSLLDELVSLGNRDLAVTLWHYFQPRSPAKPNRGSRKGAPISFESLFHKFSQSAKPKVIGKFQTQPLVLKEFNDMDIPSVQRTIMEQVLEKGSLNCGRAVGAGAGTLRAYFESCQVGDLVFTPSTELGDAACFVSAYRSQAVSWKVSSIGHLAGKYKILRCDGRRRGIYRMNGLEVQDYILA